MDRQKDRIGTLKRQRMPADFYELHAFPFGWRAKGLELHRAALVLAQQVVADLRQLNIDFRDLEAGRIECQPERPPDLLNQVVLLAAFSLENLFKGLVLFMEPTLVDSGKLKGIIRSHDLLSLASRAALSLSAEEQRLCVLASSASVYWGRYPVSDNANTEIASLMVSTALFAVFDQLALRVAAMYEARFHARTRLDPSP